MDGRCPKYETLMASVAVLEHYRIGHALERGEEALVLGVSVTVEICAFAPPAPGVKIQPALTWGAVGKTGRPGEPP